MPNRFTRAIPALVLVFFVVLTFPNLQADPAKKKRTPTPTSTALQGTKTTAAPAPAAQPTAPPTAAPAKAAAAAPAAGPAKADVDAGKALYDKFCKKCHGANGEGVQRMYDLVGAKIVPLGSKQAQGKSDAEIKKAMLDGVGKMEAVEDLTPQQADKILAFERTMGEARH